MIGSHFIIISLSSYSQLSFTFLSPFSHPLLTFLSSYPHLRLIFEISSSIYPLYLRSIKSDARMAVILSSYDTYRERTAEIERIELLPPVSYDPRDIDFTEY